MDEQNSHVSPEKKNSSPFQTKIRIFSPTALSLFYVPSYFYAILHATAISISLLNLISTYAGIRKHVCSRLSTSEERQRQNVRSEHSNRVNVYSDNGSSNLMQRSTPIIETRFTDSRRASEEERPRESGGQVLAPFFTRQ